MQLEHVTYQGPPIEDAELLSGLPADLADLLRQVNGFILHHGGLHVRGACREPAWHSLREAWLGEESFRRRYPTLTAEDVPFAQDCLGDQYLLRAGQVHRLESETGEFHSLEVSLGEFLQAVASDPVEALSMEPLLQFQDEGEKLEPGQLLSAFPPFCAAEAAEGVTLKAVPVADRLRFLADLAAKIRDLPDGATISFEVP
jgi:hypothetical protein